MTGDRVLCCADSSELKQHGLTAGLTNYSAAYCTGLLLARRLLKQVGLDQMYKANTKVDGKYFNSFENIEDKRPFKALLDVGIQRTTSGARVFGALKGACDGGLNVPHNTKRFPGYTKAKIEVVTNKRGKATDTEKSEAKYDANVHKGRIFGSHVTEYMNKLKVEDPTKFKAQFSQWSKCLSAANAKTCEDLYKKVHAAVIAKPDRVSQKKNANPVHKLMSGASKAQVYQDSKGKKWLRHRRLNLEERKARVNQKLADAMAKLM